jgi:hypothetical protein
MMMMTTCNSHEFYIKKKRKNPWRNLFAAASEERDANAEMRCCNKCVSENDARRTCLHAPAADNDKVRTQITLANLIYGLGASDLTLARTGGSRRRSHHAFTAFLFLLRQTGLLFFTPLSTVTYSVATLKKLMLLQSKFCDMQTYKEKQVSNYVVFYNTGRKMTQ